MTRTDYRFETIDGTQNHEVSFKKYREGEIDYLSVSIKRTAVKRTAVKRTAAKAESAVICRVIVPGAGVHYRFTPKLHLIKGLNLDWFNNLYRTNGFTGAPVECLLSDGGQNRAAIGLSDTLNTAGIKGIVLEETAEYAFELTLYQEGEIILRLDRRPVPYYEALQEMSLWWESLLGMTPAEVPSAAFEAMYSTWYSYHQEIKEEDLLLQCRLSGRLGCRTILLDDGWQTDDNNRGYAYCGDWQPAASKIPDMEAFVEKVHRMGMKVMLWYSVPFIGEKSQNYEQFKNRVIDPDSDREWHTLDPRYPKVREFLIGLYETALLRWKLDGFKLDFIDEFVVTPFGGKEEDEERDYLSFAEAADRLMKDCISRLKRIKPDIMLEFRQTYNGPKMRTYGNIFRAVDCPLDDMENHVRVTDIRLLSGQSAVHSDMLMWDPSDSPESAALQIIQVLFSVPQLSMRLETLGEGHRKMLSFYMQLWERYKAAFLHGSFEPGSPVSRYAVVMGRTGDTLVCTYHGRELIAIGETRDRMIFVNGSPDEWLLLETEEEECRFLVTVYDCMGEIVSKSETLLRKGISCHRVPRSGVAEWEKQSNR